MPKRISGRNEERSGCCCNVHLLGKDLHNLFFKRLCSFSKILEKNLPRYLHITVFLHKIRLWITRCWNNKLWVLLCHVARALWSICVFYRGSQWLSPRPLAAFHYKSCSFFLEMPPAQMSICHSIWIITILMINCFMPYAALLTMKRSCYTLKSRFIIGIGGSI